MDAQVPCTDWPGTVCAGYPWISDAKSWLYYRPLQTDPWEERHHQILVLFPEILRQSGSEWLEGWTIAGTIMNVQIPLWELKTFTQWSGILPADSPGISSTWELLSSELKRLASPEVTLLSVGQPVSTYGSMQEHKGSPFSAGMKIALRGRLSFRVPPVLLT